MLNTEQPRCGNAMALTNDAVVEASLAPGCLCGARSKLVGGEAIHAALSTRHQQLTPALW